MNEHDFCLWLQGFAELSPSLGQPSPEQWKSITEHLKTVFVKVTPEVQIKPSINFPPAFKPADIADVIGRACREAVPYRCSPTSAITC